MEFIIKIAQFITSLSLLIILHELGHFIPAKLFKTRVEKFYLFFDVKFSLFKKKIGDTVYGIGWLPLGGYVKISGMIDESMDKAQMALPPQPWEFRSKPAWQRLIIMVGGVTVNFILAYLIYIGMAFSYGDSDITANSIKNGYWIENPLLQEFGLQTGDNILAINDKPIEHYSDIKAYFLETQTMTIDRDGTTMVLDFPEDFLGQLSDSGDRTFVELRMPFIVSSIDPSSLNTEVDLLPGDVLMSLNGQSVTYYDEVGPTLENFKSQNISVNILRDGVTIVRELRVNDDGKIGVYPGGTYKDFSELGYFDIIQKDYNFSQSITMGGHMFAEKMGSYWGQLKLIFSPSTGAYKGVGGFKAIYDIFPDTWSWSTFWSITAFLSIMLGVLNLLPIPVLDGGHVMFLLFEMISGRKPSDRFMEIAQTVGFFLLIALVLFANGNDLFKAITG